MENQDTVEFNADAAFDEAANQLESGGLTADNEPSVANDNNQYAPDQRRENPPQESNPQAPEAKEEEPEWLANATDEVKEHFRLMKADKEISTSTSRSRTAQTKPTFL